jgi:parallel beta-helix repeat protein
MKFNELNGVKKSNIISKRIRLFSIYLFLAMILNISLLSWSQEDIPLTNISILKISASHSPISIDGNVALDTFCSSDGTDGLSWSTAHVIEGYEIEAEIVAGVGSAIEIKNTDKYLIIRDCTLEKSEGAWSAGGIFISECQNISIKNCHFSNNEVGISLWRSNHISVTESNILNGYTGIRLSNSANNSISGNTISKNNDYAIYLDSNSENNIIFQNTFCDNTAGNINDLGTNNQIHDNNECNPIISGYNLLWILVILSLGSMIFSKKPIKNCHKKSS